MVNISFIGHTHVKLCSQTLDLKHVEIIKFSDKHICDTSFERSSRGDLRYIISS